MSLLRNWLRRRDVWFRIAVERLTEPLHLNVLAAGVLLFGTTRAKIMFDLVVRQQYAFGLLHAADTALRRRLQRVTVVELGVGAGTGLLNICEIAARVSKATGIEFDIVGFDTGAGMPPPRDYRDHPELYKEGWFAMNTEALAAALPGNARLVLGHLRDTVPPFVGSLSPDAPVGFASIDVDYYSSAKDALKLFEGAASCYFPYVYVYVDDINQISNSHFAGELLAISEFNADQSLRKLEHDWTLVNRRVFKHAEWLSHMFKLQVFDHPERSDLTPPKETYVRPNPYLRG